MKRIFICGAGTVGAHLALHLARQGSREIRVVDRDRVEERNLRNQPYWLHHVGKPKVVALAEVVLRAGGPRLVGEHRQMTAGNAARLLSGSELVLDCFDNSESRQAVQAACRGLSIPCLHVGLFEEYCEVVWDERYTPPPEPPAPATCADPLSRSLALMAVVLFERALRDGTDLCCTLGDLTISSSQALAGNSSW